MIDVFCFVDCSKHHVLQYICIKCAFIATLFVHNITHKVETVWCNVYCRLGKLHINNVHNNVLTLDPSMWVIVIFRGITKSFYFNCLYLFNMWFVRNITTMDGVQLCTCTISPNFLSNLISGLC